MFEPMTEVESVWLSEAIKLIDRLRAERATGSIGKLMERVGNLEAERDSLRDELAAPNSMEESWAAVAPKLIELGVLDEPGEFKNSGEAACQMLDKLAARPAVLPEDVRVFLERQPESYALNGPRAKDLLAKYATGVPQAVESRLSAEPVAYICRDNDGMVRICRGPSLEAWAMQLGAEIGYALFPQVKPGECRGIILTEPPATYSVESLPGYQWSNAVLSVFAANGRTAYCTRWPAKDRERDGSYRWDCMFHDDDAADSVIHTTRESAERAASRYVSGESP